MGHELENVFAWLEAGDAADYQTGVLLLQEHSNHRSLVSTLLKKESALNREKLRYELVKVGCQGRLQDVGEVLNHFAQAVESAAPAAAGLKETLREALEKGPGFRILSPAEFTQALLDARQERILPVAPAPDQVPEAAQAQVEALTQRLATCYNQRVQLSNGLADLDPKEGPRVVAEILALKDQYDALAEQRRRLAACEAVEAPVDVAPAPEDGAPAPALDRAALVQQRGNLRSNISKAKKKAEAAKSEEKRSEYTQKAGKLEVELGLVDMQLALPQA